MSRRFFRTTLLHSCFCHDLYVAASMIDVSLREKRFKKTMALHKKALQQKCSCRMWVTKEEAEYLLDQNLADRLIDDRHGFSFPSWHLVLRTRTMVPRSQTIEKAHIERAYLGVGRPKYYSSDDWAEANKIIKAFAEGDLEEQLRIELESVRIFEERLEFFGAAKEKLLKLKKKSDEWNILDGRAVPQIHEQIEKRADQIKQENIKDDPWEGRSIFVGLQAEERTSRGVNRK